MLVPTPGKDECVVGILEVTTVETLLVDKDPVGDTFMIEYEPDVVWEESLLLPLLLSLLLLS